MNKSVKNIFLVGFMATGKTAVGREIARKKKWQFLDLDELIELKERRSISSIFAKEGEAYFRRIEKQALKEVAREDKFVIACGGGIVMDSDNITIMKDNGIMICLTATAEVILKRSSGFTHRPLLNVADPKGRVDLLLKLRAPYYAQAHKTIDTSKLSIKEVAGRILKLIGKKK
ncbi:MAG: shikimate kinase [Deltaproteobacteria bacterium]